MSQILSILTGTRTFFFTILCLACHSGAFGATSFVGGAGASLNSASNWSSGLPTLSNPGLLAGNASSTYTKQGDLNGKALDISGNSQLTGTKKTILTNGDITVRDSGRWEMSKDVTVGQNSGAAGSTVRVQGDGEFDVVGGKLTIGRAQKGTFIQDGGQLHVSKDILLGAQAGGAGSTYQLNDGVLTADGKVTVARGTSLNVDGGTANIAKAIAITSAGSSYTQSGGEVNAADKLTFNNRTTGTVSGGQLNVSSNLAVKQNAVLTVSGGSVSVSGDTAIENKGKITQTGGSVLLNGDLDIKGTGVYDIQGGELRVSGAITVSSANGLLWGGGSTLGVAPGDSTIQYNGNLNAGPGSRLDLNNPGEMLLVLNNLNLNGLIVDGYDMGLPAYSGSVQSGQLLLIQAALINGTESDIAFTNFVGLEGMTQINPGDAFNAATDSVYWFNVTGTQVTLDWSLGLTAPIPEPSTALMLLLGTVGVFCRRRRKNDCF